MLEALERPRRLKLWTDEFQNDTGQNHEKKRKRLRERRREKRDEGKNPHTKGKDIPHYL